MGVCWTASTRYLSVIKEVKVARFTEDDFELEVNVLEDRSDKEWKRYKLKVRGFSHPSRFFPHPKVGEEFDVSQRREGAWGGMWRLYATEEELAKAKKEVL
jgi:hypothetical protein